MGSIKDNVYQIIRAPKITEKTALVGSTSHCVVFEVHPKANKAEIKNAVEKVFEVKVTGDRTVNYMGKVKSVRGRIGRQNGWKKAYITLAEGSKIDLIDGL